MKQISLAEPPIFQAVNLSAACFATAADRSTARAPWVSSIRRIIFVLLAVCTSAAYAEPDTQSGAIQVVAQLYRDFAWEAIIDEPEWVGHDLLDQPRLVLERYFDHDLATLILQDRQCATRTHEICRLDFSPIWASQDPGASEIKIVADVRPDIVSVKFRYPSDGTKIKLSYQMVETNIGWRIADIRYSSGSTLLSILSAKP